MARTVHKRENTEKSIECLLQSTQTLYDFPIILQRGFIINLCRSVYAQQIAGSRINEHISSIKHRKIRRIFYIHLMYEIKKYN